MAEKETVRYSIDVPIEIHNKFKKKIAWGVKNQIVVSLISAFANDKDITLIVHAINDNIKVIPKIQP